MGLKLRVEKGDKILIGREIIIEATGVKDGSAHLEITAPRDVEINGILRGQDGQRGGNRKR